MHTELPAREQAEAFLAVQRQRHRINLDQLQVFKGRHLMGQEVYRQLIERLAKVEQEWVKEGEADRRKGEQSGLQVACAIVGEALQEAHGMMLQQAGSVRENEAMSVLLGQVLAQPPPEPPPAEVEPPPAEAEQPAAEEAPGQGRAYTDTPGHVGVMCSDQGEQPDAAAEADVQPEKVDVPLRLPSDFEAKGFRLLKKEQPADMGADLIGKTVRQALQEARPGRPDWKPPSWMSGCNSALKSVQ